MFKLSVLRNSKSMLQGHTLTEVLLVVAIIGTVAVFGVPKMIYSNSVDNRVSGYREIIAMLAQLQQEGMMTGELTQANFVNYFFDKMNTAKVCKTNAFTQGCVPYQMGTPGVILPNGVEVIMIQRGAESGWIWTATGEMFLKWGPNVPDINPTLFLINSQHWSDFLMVTMCYGPKQCDFKTYGNQVYQDPGTIIPLPAVVFGFDMVSIYEGIFKN